jgi:hypothetical protein
MKKDQFGVWEITVPPKSPGVCAIPHDSKLKVRIPRVFSVFLLIVADLDDSTLRRAHRAPASMD